MPVVRQLLWIGLITQFIAIAVLAGIAYVAFPVLGIPFDIFIAALAYLIFCGIMRATLTRDHRSGMRAYRAQKLQDAISYFEASYDFFSKRRRLDTWRALLFGVASPNPYRVIALCNTAYCYAQAGNGQRAIKLYEQALHEEPGCALAKAGFRPQQATNAT